MKHFEMDEQKKDETFELCIDISLYPRLFSVETFKWSFCSLSHSVPWKVKLRLDTCLSPVLLTFYFDAKSHGMQTKSGPDLGEGYRQQNDDDVTKDLFL